MRVFRKASARREGNERLVAQAHSAETETSLRTGSVPSKRTQRKTPNLRSTLPR
jgi:hypothetical protein